MATLGLAMPKIWAMDFHEQLAAVADDLAASPQLDSPRRDPGTPFAAMVALLIVIGIYGMIVLSNIIPGGQGEPADGPNEWTPELRETQFNQTRRDQVAVVSRILMYLDGRPWLPDGFVESQMPREDDVKGAGLLYRVVMLGEFLGAEQALKGLEDIDQQIPDPEGEGDAPKLPGEAGAGEYLRRVYSGTLDDAPLSPELLDAQDYLGWWAKLARLHNAERDDPARVEMVENGRRVFVLISVVGVAGILVAIGATAACIYIVVRLSRRSIKARIVPPVPGGSVYLEIFGVFLCGFLVISIVGDIVTKTNPGNPQPAIYTALVGQWALILVPLWPLVRGVPLSRLRADLGLHRGQGVFREIGAGVVGYLAGLPLLVAGYIAMVVLMVIVNSFRPDGDPIAPNNPVLEMVQNPSVLVLVLSFSLAVIWAPLVEETVFRGALLRHVRGRTGIIGGTLITALVFAFLHPYGPVFTPPLIALGVTFALLRQWRGSLIAPMTAHFLHNGTLLAVFITAMSIVG